MALHADTIWEVRTTGNNNNGGGWHDLGGASVDYSEQDAPQLSVADAVANGTTTVTSATGGFTAAMAGSLINILTKGRFEIAVVTDGNTITVDRNVAAGTGLTANVGGGVADLEQVDSLMVSGNTLHVKAGTYVSAGALAFTNGSSAVQITLDGYNASRGDNPRGDNRPLLTLGAQSFTLGNYNLMRNFRATTTHTSGILLSAYSQARNVKCENTGVNATDRAFRTGPAYLIDCEAICGNGIGIYLNAICKVLFCKVHDCLDGIQCYTNADYSLVAYNIVKDCSQTGLFADGCNGMMVIHNNFDDCDKGIDANAITFWIILNNQLTSCNTLGATFDTLSVSNILDGNNWFDNGTDVSGMTKGPGATAKDPSYAGEDDFSDVDDADAIVMLLGVG